MWISYFRPVGLFDAPSVLEAQIVINDLWIMQYPWHFLSGLKKQQDNIGVDN